MSTPTTNIPLVRFHARDLVNDSIEVFRLDSIYKRKGQMDHDPSKPHRVQFHCLIYIEQGRGSHFIDFEDFPYQAGSFISVGRHQIQSFDFVNQPKGDIILFTKQWLDSVQSNIRVPFLFPSFSSFFSSPVINTIGPLRQSCESLLLEMKKIKGDQAFDDMVLQLLFTTLLIKLYREKPTQYVNQLGEIRARKFTRFLSMVEEHFVTTKSATAYAEMMGITYKSLNQICKLATNKTPKQLIDAHTILEAKRRLAIDDTAISRLAYELGFEEPSNFIKYFKSKALITPHQFKKIQKG